MATLYITEYARQARDGAGYLLPVGEEPALAEQNVAIGVSSTQSATLNANTKFVRLNTDSTCSLAFGENPTAVTTARRMTANVTEYVGIDNKQPYSWKIAVIANT